MYIWDLANIFTLDFRVVLSYTFLGSSATVQMGIVTFFPHRISLESYDKPRETAIL